MRLIFTLSFLTLFFINPIQADQGMGSENTDDPQSSEFSSSLEYFLHPGNLTKNKWFQQEFDLLVSAFKRKLARSPNKKVFLEQLYFKIHQKFLKKYRQYSDISMLLEDGYYDCVSGTALYGLVLNQLGFNFRIKETDFHIYLIVQLDDQRIILESTDPLYGFMDEESNKTELVKIIGEHARIDQDISIGQLAGLQFYNLAVSYYNNQQPELAHEYLQRAIEFYDCSRMRDLEDLIDSATPFQASR